ncbi:hypothetical protein MLPF_3110 [Mycobacterium lepromatosis]|nr:hypothetical protein MLPF_3110 [Mycobacterium lepromatosis]
MDDHNDTDSNMVKLLNQRHRVSTGPHWGRLRHG